MKKIKFLQFLQFVVVVGTPLMMLGCAFFSPGSRPSLLGGDADLSLIANRTSKNVSKIQEAPNSTNSGSSIAEPTGGGTIDISPGSLTNLVRAVAAVAPLVAVQSPRVEEVQARGPVVKAVVRPSYYTVRNGDSLWDIARSNGTTVAALKKVNGLKSSVIHPGQVLRLPRR